MDMPSRIFFSDSRGLFGGEVTFVYRHLYYDQKDDKLLQDIRFSGLALGATFRF
jgi:hypothetical protein